MIQGERFVCDHFTIPGKRRKRSFVWHFCYTISTDINIFSWNEVEQFPEIIVIAIIFPNVAITIYCVNIFGFPILIVCINCCIFLNKENVHVGEKLDLCVRRGPPPKKEVLFTSCTGTSQKLENHEKEKKKNWSPSPFRHPDIK